MSGFRIRANEGETAQPLLSWDSVWLPSEGYADWSLADPDETQNRGGLRAKAALHTAVILCLFTDKFCPKDHRLNWLVEDEDRRGWFGDGEDIDESLGEREMGSLLWLLARAPLNETIRREAEVLALEALETLKFQKACSRIEAVAVANQAVGRLELAIRLYGRDGKMLYDQKFDAVWRQSETSPPPLPFPDFPTR